MDSAARGPGRAPLSRARRGDRAGRRHAARSPPGTRLPPQRDLAYRLGVTVGTVSRAYALVAARGLVAGEVGRGTFVRALARAPASIRSTTATPTSIKLTVNAPPDPCDRAHRCATG